MENIESLQLKFKGAGPEKILEHFLDAYRDRIALASSLGAEDQVLTHMALAHRPGARIFMIDTGRLHQETYDTAAETSRKYGMRYEVYFPDNRLIEEMANAHGLNPFYESIDLRHRCCGVRKVEPLKRALATVDAWITGMRREQSVTRKTVEIIEHDEANGIIKVNPLASWSAADVWGYIRKNDIPYNKLHDKNFQSIGCASCTRAVRHGEEQRAGRWWWEEPEQRECGLHVKARNIQEKVIK